MIIRDIMKVIVVFYHFDFHSSIEIQMSETEVNNLIYLRLSYFDHFGW